MKIRDKIVKIDIQKIKEYEKNNKNHPVEQISLLVQNIDKFGFTNPLLIDKNNIIIAGHARFKAAQKLNLKTLPCIRIDDLSEQQIKALRISDNRLSELAETNFDFLKEEFFELKESGLDFLTGYNDEDFDFLEDEKEVEEDDFEVPEDVEEIKTDIKLGDIFKLGEHKLMCGSSTEEKDVGKLMDGEKAVMAHNDPPYGMKKEKDGVKNDNLNFNDLLEFNKDWINLQFEYLKDNGSWYCWGIDEPLMDIYNNIIKPFVKKQKATFRNLLTWDKGNGQGQMAEDFRMYPIADEKCLFVMMGVQGFNNNADNYFEGWEPIRDYLLKSRLEMGWSVPDMKRVVGHSDLSRDHWTSKSQFNMPTKEVYNKMKSEADRLRNKTKNDAFKKEYDELKKEYDELKKEYDELKKEYYSTRAYFNNTHENQNNVWHFNRTNNQERDLVGGHATPKPLELCQRVIKSSSCENDLVLDFFGGSGSTLIACEQLNRKCYMMELDEKYCQVIINRWEALTNKKAEKING